jgi:hypothetical protein
MPYPLIGDPAQRNIVVVSRNRRLHRKLQRMQTSKIVLVFHDFTLRQNPSWAAV